MVKSCNRVRRIGSLAVLFSLVAQSPVIAQRVQWTADELAVPFPPASTEKELIETLRSDAVPAAKAFACKQLSIYGSKAAVPELAKLLADKQLASWARIALEAIPDAAVDQALIEAAKKLEGKLLVGVINSIGVRRSTNAVDPLIMRLRDRDEEVASAAAVALGRIGGDKAADAAREAFAGAPPAVRSAIAEGGILYAERLLAEGKNAAAASIYDEIRHADLPQQRVLEATRGAIVARGEQGIPLLIEQLKSQDKAHFQIALSAARELPGNKAAEALADELDRTSPDRAALMVHAIGDRPNAALPPAVVEAARKGDAQVRRAAIEVIGKLGDASSIDALIEIAGSSNEELSQAAKSALAQLPGDAVNAELVRRIDTANGETLAVLFETIGERRIDATDHLVKAIHHADAELRRAALLALGETVSASDLNVLISAATEANNKPDAETAWEALEAASIRMPDREATAAQLTAAMSRGNTETKTRLLRILGAMGGPTALETIAATVKSGDDQAKDVGTDVLGKWMTADAAPVLLDIAIDPSTDKKYQVRALRGYLRIARQLDLPDSERLVMCRKALEVAQRPDERKLVLDALKRCQSAEAIELASAMIDDRELRQPAVETAIFIAEKIKASDPAAAKSAGEKALQSQPSAELAERARALTSP